MGWHQSTSVYFGSFIFLLFLCITHSGSAQGMNDALASLTDKLELSEAEKAQFTKRAEERTRLLGDYLEIVSSKNRSIDDRRNAIDLACKLFIHDSTYVQVSSLNQKEYQRYSTRQYLNRLMALQYDRVVLEWREIFFVTELRKGVDGTYSGTITAQQLFRGVIDGKIKYQDVTEKDIEIQVRPFEKQVGDTIEIKWDVFLGNISVSETREK